MGLTRSLRIFAYSTFILYSLLIFSTYEIFNIPDRNTKQRATTPSAPHSFFYNQSVTDDNDYCLFIASFPAVNTVTLTYRLVYTTQGYISYMRRQEYVVVMTRLLDYSHCGVIICHYYSTR